MPDLVCSAIVTNNSDCGRGGEILVNASGGVPFSGSSPYSISYSPALPSGTSIDNIPPGTWCAIVRDANNRTCKTNEVTIQDVTPPLNVIISNLQPGNSCTGVGGSADIEIIGGCPGYACSIGLLVNGEKQGGSDCSISSNINPGLYFCCVRDAMGNEFNTQFRIEDMQVTALEAGVLTTNAAGPCQTDSGSISFTASGGCPSYNVSIVTSADPGTVVATGPISDVFNLRAGTYVATISDSNNESTSVPFTIDLANDPISQAGTISVDESCNVSFPLSGGTTPYSLVWLSSAGNIVSEETTADLSFLVELVPDTITITDTYNIVVTDANGCVMTFSQEISCNGLIPTIVEPCDLMIENPGASLTSCADDQNCIGIVSGDIVQCEGFGPYNITITDQQGNVTNITRPEAGPFAISNLCKGVYTMVVRDGMGTDWFQGNSYEVTGPDDPVDITLVRNSCAEDGGLLEVALSGGVGGPFDFDWTLLGESVGNTETIESLDNGSYFLEAADANGCTASRVYEVLCEMIDEPCDLFDGTPVITPNGDGQNETLFINCSDSGDYELQIFDRWGRMVYSVEDYNNDWNGVDNDGQRLLEGAYYWVLFVDNGTTTSIEKGTITLLRNE